MRGYLELTTEQRLRRGRTEADDRARLDQRDLTVEPWPARGDLAGVRFLVDAPLAARLPLEVFDDVRDVDRGAIDAGVLERAIEQLPRWTDEGMAGKVLRVTRLLAHEHQPSFGRALSEYSLGPQLPKIAGAAVP